MTPRPPDIFFHPDAVESEGKDLVGRRSAGQSFLKGWLAHVPHGTSQIRRTKNNTCEPRHRQNFIDAVDGLDVFQLGNDYYVLICLPVKFRAAFTSVAGRASWTTAACAVRRVKAGRN